MRFNAFSPRLNDLSGGTLTLGMVPWPRLIRTEAGDVNLGAVTVLGADTLVISVDLGTVVAGDRILLFAWWEMLKGATAGASAFFIHKVSGAGTVQFTSVTSRPGALLNPHALATRWGGGLGALAEVLTGGTLVMGLSATSVGSNGTVDADDGSLYGAVLIGG